MILCRKRLLLLLSVAMVSCSSDPIAEAESGDVSSAVDVILPVKGDGVTRTGISNNGLSVDWVVGDQVAVWADGATNLVGETFQLKYFGSTYQDAEFATSLTESMTEGEYTYRGFYPVPKSISGKSITYEIPSSQSGAYDGDLDFRVADPVTGRELTESTMNGVDALSFRSLMHAMKITIPEGQNDLSDNPIAQLIITMPESVVGDMSFDMSQTTSAATMSNGGTIVTLDFGEEDQISEGDGNYAWFFFNPTTISAGSVITFVAVDTAGVMSADYELTFDADHTFAAARITPVNIYVPKETTITSFEISIGENDVNDIITDVTISASGMTFLESGKSSVTFEVNDEKSDVLRFSYDNSLNTTSAITVAFESLYTKTTYTIAAADIAEKVINSRVYDIPALLDEDFSGVKTSFEQNEGLAMDSSTSTTGTSTSTNLSTHGVEGGWVASRFGVDATNKAMRLEGFETNSTKYPATLTSPTINRLKKGATVTVSYSYSGAEEEYRYDGTFGNGYKGNPIYSFSSNLVSYVSSTQQGTGCSYSKIKSTYTKTGITISSDYASLYFTWTATTDKDERSTLLDANKTYWQNGCYWLYLDNIKVVLTNGVIK